MASLGNVSRYLRQRRAIGKPITDADRRMAWEAYMSTEADKSNQRRALAIQEDQLDLASRTNAEEMAIRREEMENADTAATVKGAVDVATLAGSETGQKAIASITGIGKTLTGAQSATQAISSGALGAGAMAGVAPAASSASLGASFGAGAMAGVGAGQAITGTAATTSALPALSTFAMPAAAGLAGGSWAGKQAMKSDTIQGFAEDATFGILHAKKDVAKVAGGMGGAAIGMVFGGPVGAIIGGVAGAVGGDSWICTKTKELVGFQDHEWIAIAKFRKYAAEKHPEYLASYLKIGPHLLKAMDGDEKFYEDLKKAFLQPVIELSKGGFMEAAYQTYKAVTLQLIEKYDPSLLDEVPEAA